MQAPSDTVGLDGKLTYVPIASCDDETVEAIRTMRNHPLVRAFLFTDREVTKSEHENWVAAHRSGNRPPCFAVLLGGKLAGTIGITRIGQADRSAEWGFYVDPRIRRRGIASSMWRYFLDKAFDEYGIETIFAEVLECNEGSIRLHRRFGFHQIACERTSLRQDGSTRRILRFGMKKHQWRKNRKAVTGAVED